MWKGLRCGCPEAVAADEERSRRCPEERAIRVTSFDMLWLEWSVVSSLVSSQSFKVQNRSKLMFLRFLLFTNTCAAANKKVTLPIMFYNRKNRIHQAKPFKNF